MYRAKWWPGHRPAGAHEPIQVSPNTPAGCPWGAWRVFPEIFFYAPVDYRSSPWSGVRGRSATCIDDAARGAIECAMRNADVTKIT
jgi:hypothetical protein